MQKLAILIKSAYTPACCMWQAMFAHGAGWAINITTFKQGEFLTMGESKEPIPSYKKDDQVDWL